MASEAREQPTAPRSKLEEQATAKADLSYSYWAAYSTSSVPPPQPKKLTEEEAKQTEAAATHTMLGASAWNFSGTFEERDWTKWSKEQLGQLLAGVAVKTSGSSSLVSVSITELASCSGEAHQWIVRQKKRAGFEFSDVRLRWSAELAEGGASLAGTARIPHAAADELDELELVDVEITGGGDVEAAKDARAAVLKLLPELEAQFQKLLDLLAQK